MITTATINMITIITPVEVAPTLVRAFESEGVGRERTNQLVLRCCGHDDYQQCDYVTCDYVIVLQCNYVTMRSKDKPARPKLLWS